MKIQLGFIDLGIVLFLSTLEHCLRFLLQKKYNLKSKYGKHITNFRTDKIMIPNNKLITKFSIVISNFNQEDY
jgi:hypothetical protein